MSRFCPRPEPLGAGGLSWADVCDVLVVSREASGLLFGSELDAAEACAPPPAAGGGVAVVLVEIDEAMAFRPFRSLDCL